MRNFSESQGGYDKSDLCNECKMMQNYKTHFCLKKMQVHILPRAASERAGDATGRVTERFSVFER